METKNKQKKTNNPIVFLLIDGFGVDIKNKVSCISQIHTPTLDNIIKKYPVALLNAYNQKLSKNYLDLGGREKNNFTKIISEHGLKQIKISEVEKYVYLNVFLNGGEQKKRELEERILVKSKTINDYSKEPKMATPQTVKKIIDIIKKEEFDLITASLASLDLVSYTNDQNAIKTAIKNIDQEINKIIKVVLGRNGILFIGACKGGAERINKKSKQNFTVPFLGVSNKWEGKTMSNGEVPGGDLSLMKKAGNLKDIKTTILHSLGIDQQKEKGKILIK